MQHMTLFYNFHAHLLTKNQPENIFQKNKNKLNTLISLYQDTTTTGNYYKKLIYTFTTFFSQVTLINSEHYLLHLHIHYMYHLKTPSKGD